MDQSYKVLLHVTFQKQVKEVTTEYPDLLKPFGVALQKLKDDPVSGKTLHDVAAPHLKGKVFRVRVGNRQGHRLIYLCIAKKLVVIPVFLSPVPREDFDYDDVPWEDYCEAVYKDWSNNNTKAFSNLK